MKELIKREKAIQRGFIGLDRNENLDPILAYEVDEHIQSVKGKGIASLYPDYPALYKQIATHFQIKPNQMLLTAGCSEAIRIAADYYVVPGSSILVLDPTYTAAVSLFSTKGATIHKLPSGTPMPDIVQYIQHNKINFFYLCNPNNPDGYVYTPYNLLSLLKTEAIVFVDESYYEFSQVTMCPSIAKRKNFIIGSSFSKAWGLAGLRAGLLLAHKDTIATLEPYRLRASVNSIACECIRHLITNKHLVDKSVADINGGRYTIRNALTKNGYALYSDTTVNFIWCDYPSAKLTRAKYLHKVIGGRTCFTVVPQSMANDFIKDLGLV